MAKYQLTRRQTALIAVFAVLLVFPIVLAAMTPILAPIPQATAGWTAPPLPDRDEPLPGFEDLLEPLPLVVRDLPDQSSLDVVNLYDATTYSNLPEAQALMNAAISAIGVPAHVQHAWELWLADPDARSVPTVFMESLADDPLNGDRLSNLATAMFFLSIAREPNAMPGTSYHALKPAQLMSSSVRYFPKSRAVNINNFYFRLFVESLSAIQPELELWMRENPEDPAILRLSVEKSIGYSQTTLDSSGFNEVFMREFLVDYALQFTTSDDSARVAFGYAMLGDLHLGSLGIGDLMGNSRLENAPFTIKDSARDALGYYDQALLLSDDPSLYLARALTLSLLGDSVRAIGTIERAIEIHPDSLMLHGYLAEFHLAKRGSSEEIRESMLVARDIQRQRSSIYLRNESQLLAQTRIVTNWVSSSLQVANVPMARSDYKGHMGGGGGYGVAFDMIPAYETMPRGVIALSEALGDPQGVLADAERLGLDSVEHNVAIAGLVADPTSATLEGLQDLSRIEGAANWLRFAGKPQQAQSLCEAALRVTTDEWDARRLRSCVAESAYLAGDYETALDSYRSNDNHLMAGYVLEAQGNPAEARVTYQLESGFGHPSYRYQAILRLGGVLLELEEYDAAAQIYDEWLGWAEADDCGHIRCISCVGDDCVEVTHLIPHGLSNRGIARLQATADSSGTIDCSGDAREACLAAAQDFDAALKFDGYNPVFLMNRAWVARLLGDKDQSVQLMNKALESDPTLYPVLVDLGVYAAQNDDPEAAREHFLNAVAANPDYDLGWWNLGVLEMRKGPQGIIRGQAYLARAIKRNPSFRNDSLNFKTDESIYRVEITEQDQPGAAWSFSTASSLAATAFGAVGLLVVAFHASKEAFKDKLLEEAMRRRDSVKPWLEKNVDPVLARFNGLPYASWIVMVVAVFVMILVAIVPAWRGDPGAAAASITVALLALALATMTHEFGHRFSAKLMKAELEPVQWNPGIGLSLFLLPFNMSSGPYPAQRVKSDDETNTLWVYLFGPLANLAVAFVAYIVYLNQPLPLLRVIVITQLAVMGYSLLPFEPLDGAPLSRAQPKLIGALSFVALIAGILFSLGLR